MPLAPDGNGGGTPAEAMADNRDVHPVDDDLRATGSLPESQIKAEDNSTTPVPLSTSNPEDQPPASGSDARENSAEDSASVAGLDKALTSPHIRPILAVAAWKREVPRAPLGSKAGWTTMPGAARARGGNGRASPTVLAQRRGMAAVGALRRKFPVGISLPEHWGLLALVDMGEAWLPNMLERDASAAAATGGAADGAAAADGGQAPAWASRVGDDGRDDHVSKLFEFLVASLCLYMTEETLEAERRGLDLFVLSAPAASSSGALAEGRGRRGRGAGGGALAAKHHPQTWWTVDARAPEPEASAEEGSVRTVSLLLGLLGMHLDSTWKVVQL